MKCGQGTLLFKNGDKYEGEFREDMQSGFGTHWTNVQGKLILQYRGSFWQGRRHGHGIFAYKDGGKYDGEWQNGKRHGEGRMNYTDGTVYEGMWENGKRHGAGTLFLANGDVYQGDYALDLKDGPGTFFYVSKKKRYDGVWSKDVAKCGLYGSIETDGDCGLPGLQLLEPMAVLEEQAYKLQHERAAEHSMRSEGGEGNDLTRQVEERNVDGHGTTGGSLGIVHEREEESFNIESNSMLESEQEEVDDYLDEQEVEQ
mmetsp:Transcript_25188/g.83162  ORF Transcript_25188/g.83162 Transcript_25188/m.83162 type:complete len:257 (+) Transcript_25188:336-1106(+)